ncbi:MAG: glycosyltransferase [Desulfovibrionaceae bacterium]|jgi:glycosyltransferase involved in cell wall biosynthesis|nr:glycosyltransferase [Desulfovibrionaceae bacterium]
MRVLHVVNVRWFNATAWYGLTLARLMRDAGHEVLAVCLPDTAPLARAREWGLDAATLDLNTGHPLRLAALCADMHRLVRDFRPDVVDCHRGEAFVLWGLLKSGGAPFKLVRTRGDQRLPRNNLFNRHLHRRTADAVVATNSAMLAHFRDALGVPPERLHLIFGGVDEDAFRFDGAGRARVRAEFGFADGDVVYGLLGRFDEVKGQRETIEALARVRARHGMERAKLLLIGHDSAQPESLIRSWIAEAGLDAHVAVTGLRDDVAACISALDVGVLASKWSETIARAALEIMACGRPLVSTRVGVMPDLMPAEALCAPADATALAALMARAATDPAFLARVRADQQHRLPQLTGHAFLSQSLGLFQSLLG